MSPWSALILSHALWGLLAMVLLMRLRRNRHRLRQVAAHQARQHEQVQALRRALNAWLMDGSPAGIGDLQQTITRITALQNWWLPCNGAVVTEAQLAASPFGAQAHLATMALQTHQTVHQHQLAQWGWASSYVPVGQQGQTEGVLLLAGGNDLSIADHALAVALADMLCHAWAHAAHRPCPPAITPT